jgi:putative ABC transport system ATP-binding protein
MTDNGHTIVSSSQAAFLCLEDLSKKYVEGNQDRIVLEDTNISFAKAEFVAILGKSGSGKTTLLNLISGIDLPDQGSVWIDGQNLTGMDDHHRTLFRRKNIGFVFQFFNLIPTLTVFENLTLPLELNRKLDKAGERHARELLESVGLPDRSKTYPDRLSGGEQQRVAIARALVHDPMLILADEPTGNLDDDTGRQVMVLLDRLTRQSGKNLVLVTHNPESAAFADRMLYLHRGKLAEAKS